MGLLKDVRLETQGDVLIVVVEERPTVADVDFSGTKEFDKDTLKTARTLARDSWDQALILIQLEQMAIARGDDEQREKILKAFIALDPKDRWHHGNYGWFLLERDRYDEAISEFDKAMALGGYPNAKQGLDQALRARGH